VLKVGFNHRYHPAIAEAHRLVSSGELGPIINIRARYGHGGRPGYEKEWRGDPNLAGGGELLDQGVHIADLLCWFAGTPKDVVGMLQTAVWPIAPLEDNAFALIRFESGAVASLHTSWTQWKNLFSFEVFCRDGAAIVDGLGGSYGVERLIVNRRRSEGGRPDVSETPYDSQDNSWELEWSDFLVGIPTGRVRSGGTADGVRAMRLIDSVYKGAATPVVSR
jgi:predicted dehydrogenase